jgi:hypothetical protein
MAYQRTTRTLAAALALVSICTGRGAAQPSGLIETPIGNRLAINVTEVRALTVEPRFVPEGMYYATVHLTIANLAGAGSDRTLLQPSAFRVMTHQGIAYSPADEGLALRGGAAVANLCRVIYLVGNRPASCYLIFLLPTSVKQGFLEFAPFSYDVVAVPIAIRE